MRFLVLNPTNREIVNCVPARVSRMGKPVMSNIHNKSWSVMRVFLIQDDGSEQELTVHYEHTRGVNGFTCIDGVWYQFPLKHNDQSIIPKSIMRLESSSMKSQT